MKFRTLLGSVLGLEISLLGMAAQASYVVEAESMGAGRSAIATGAAFDFVARDFGMEPGDAMRITLRNLASASNLRGNLLLWSLAPPPESTSPDALADAGSPAAALVAAGPVTPGSGEDFSHYDDGDDSIETVSAATEAGAVGGARYPLVAGTGELLPVSGHEIPPIDAKEIFWILRPTEFTSFSQLTAARFGFDHSQ